MHSPSSLLPPAKGFRGVPDEDSSLLDAADSAYLGVGIRGPLGDIDPLNHPVKRAIRRVKKGPLLRGLPNPA